MLIVVVICQDKLNSTTETSSLYTENLDLKIY